MSLPLSPIPSRSVSSLYGSPSSVEPLGPSSRQSNRSTTSLGTVQRPQQRRISIHSIKSASSELHEGSLGFNENQDPLRQIVPLGGSPKDLDSSKPLQRKKSNANSYKSSWGIDNPVLAGPPANSIVTESAQLENVELSSEKSPEIDKSKLSGATNAGETGTDRWISTGEVQVHNKEQKETKRIGTISTNEETPFSRWVQSLRRKTSSLAGLSTSGDESHKFGDNLWAKDFFTAPASQTHHHHKRSSLASSTFITGVRSATASVETGNTFPRSRGNTMLSSNTRDSGPSTGDARMSSDSSQPLASRSVDDAVWTRAVKRRQILQEIITSEESYVSDLKALVNVYFTLLASTPSLTGRTRDSIQTNVMEILQMHEGLVKKFRKVIPNSEHRIPMEEPGTKRHVRWRSLELPVKYRGNGHRKKRSIGLPATWTGEVVLTAEPSECAKVARIFMDMMGEFFAYQEYCAKYELMVQDVAATYQNIPDKTAYEQGMEALAKCLASINSCEEESRKCLTMPDLMIKPIQRVCKYPLLLGVMLKNTPVCDGPEAHAEIDKTLDCFRETVREINKATDDRVTKNRIQTTWLLQDKLVFPDALARPGIYRTLGHVRLCGVLHVAYQTRNSVQGEYMLCILFKSYLLLAAANEDLQRFTVAACVHLGDIKIEAAEDGKGLQCYGALYSWKMVFESDNRLFELVFSACSAKEEEVWKSQILFESSAEEAEVGNSKSTPRELYSTTLLDMKPAGQIFGQPGTLARQLSIQRAATIGTKLNVCQVIIKNTHVLRDNEPRYPTSPSMNRSQSLLSTHRIPVLAPKRSDRIRLEQVVANIWTKDQLPFPGMVAARGDQIKASANSVMRKLSFVGMSGAFARRSTSATALTQSQSSDEAGTPVTEEAALGLSRDGSTSSAMTANEVGALEQEHEQLFQSGQDSTVSISGFRRLRRKHTRKLRQVSERFRAGSPQPTVTEKGVDEDESKSKKRWSNPFGVVKSTSEGIKNLFA